MTRLRHLGRSRDGPGSPAVQRSGRLLGVAAVFISLTGGAVACSSGSAPPVAPEADAVLAQGRQVWTSECARCHGQAGLGGVGPRIADRVVEQFPDPAAEADVIASGRQGMPPFRRTLSAEEIEAVVRYTREIL